MPAQHNFTVWIGTNDQSPTIIPGAAGDALFDHTGSSWLLVARKKTCGSIIFVIDGVIDDGTGKVSFPISIQQSRLVPIGNNAVYEIERRIGATEEVWLFGALIGAGGVNTDG